MTYPNYNKRLLKLALRIRSEVAGVEAKDLSTYLPEHLWQRSQVLAARIEKAKSSRLGLAASKLARDLKYSIDCLHQHLRRMSEQVHETSRARQFASPSELYSDLVALQTEFDEVEWDLAARTVSVNTEPIVLDGIDLGPFEIRLHWDRLNCHQPYDAIALQPNRSCLNDSVTHPHVQDDAVCEGEGSSSIARSLEEGRLFDFFLLVRGVLTTYNASSAYVPLRRWSGTPCPDCDDVVDEDSLTYCSGCDRTICDGCSTCCRACSETVCCNCVQSCSDCGHSLCQSCQTQCESCDVTLCPSCQIENRCKTCHEEIESEQTDNSGGTADATVQPVGVGEATVLA